MYNNLKGPRFNPRTYRENIVCEELYEQWKEKTGRTETFKEFKEIWNLIADTLVEKVVEERDGIRLAKGLGDVYMGYLPNAKKEFIDYQASIKYGKKIRHENWDTNMKPGKIIYGTTGRKYIYKRARWWSFSACRNFKRIVGKAFKEFPERYKNSIEKRTAK